MFGKTTTRFENLQAAASKAEPKGRFRALVDGIRHSTAAVVPVDVPETLESSVDPRPIPIFEFQKPSPQLKPVDRASPRDRAWVDYLEPDVNLPGVPNMVDSEDSQDEGSISEEPVDVAVKHWTDSSDIPTCEGPELDIGVELSDDESSVVLIMMQVMELALEKSSLHCRPESIHALQERLLEKIWYALDGERFNFSSKNVKKVSKSIFRSVKKHLFCDGEDLLLLLVIDGSEAEECIVQIFKRKLLKLAEKPSIFSKIRKL